MEGGGLVMSWEGTWCQRHQEMVTDRAVLHGKDRDAQGGHLVLRTRG